MSLRLLVPDKKGSLSRILGQSIILLFILFGIWGYVLVFTKDQKYIFQDIFIRGENIHSLFQTTSNQSVKEVISFLTEQEIQNAYVPHYLNFLFLYLSREQISAASLYETIADRYPEMTERVQKSEQFAIICYQKNPISTWVSSELNSKGIQYRTQKIGEFIIYYPLTRRMFSPG